MANYFSGYDISGYGMSAQRARVNTISSNIANAETTRTSEGGPYKRRDVVFMAQDFESVLQKNMNGLSAKTESLKYEDPLDEHFFEQKPSQYLHSVRVDKIVRDDSSPKMKYEPHHPDANNEGYVAYPNINPVIEMANLVEATRAYQANVAAFESGKALGSSTLSLLQ